MTTLEPAAAPPPAARPNPYPGARPFRYGETIHGRSREIAELRDLLIAKRVVLLYSPSGAGKSSLLEAGLRPELEQRDFRVLPTIRVSLGAPPSPAVPVRNRYVLSTILSLEEGRPAERLLSGDELARISLDEYFARVAADDPAGLDPCFVFDQFEELVTLDPTDVDAKAAFLSELGVALRDRGRWALFAMREDFIAQLDPYLGRLPTRLATRYRLDLLGPPAAKEAAKRPAAVLGVAFTDEAASRLIDDLRRVKVQRAAVVTEELGPYVEPVQLQVACRRLWSNLGPGEQDIGIEAVTALGSVDEALADFYVDAIRTAAASTGAAEREIRTWVDTKLITEQGFRAQALEGPGRAGPAVLAALEDAHLIRSEQRRGTLWYELSHDRLVAPVRADNAAWRLEHLSPLQQEAQAWDRQGRPAGLLMTGEVLAESEVWAAAHAGELLAVDHEYLDACRAEEQRLELQRTVARRNKVLAIAATAVGIVAIVGLVWALGLRNEAVRAKGRAETAEADARDALDRQLAAEADKAAAEAANERIDASNAWLSAAARAGDTQTRILAWRAAYRVAPEGISAEQVRQLTSAQHYLAHDPLYLAEDIALDRTGTTMARASSDSAVELVDVDTLVRRPLGEGAASARAVTFSPTDDRLAVLGANVSVWDTATGTVTAEAELPEIPNSSGIGGFEVAGPLVALVATQIEGAPERTDDDRGPLVVWDATTGEPVDPPTTDPVTRMTLSADGSTLAAVDNVDERVRVWRRDGGAWTEVLDERGAVAANGAVTLDADGSLLALGVRPAGDGVVLRVVDLVDGSRTAAWVNPDPFSSAVATAAVFLPGGLVRWSDDAGLVRQAVLDGSATLGVVESPARAHEGARFSSDGSRLVLNVGTPAFHTVLDADGTVLVGRDAAATGSTDGGRSVVVADSGSVDEQLGGEPAWRRGVARAFPPRASSDGRLRGRPSVSPDGAAVAYLQGPAVAPAGSDAGGDVPAVPVVMGGPLADAARCEPGPYREVAHASAPVLAAGPDGQNRVCVDAPGPEPNRLPLQTGEQLRSLAVGEDGVFTVTGTEYLGAGSVVVYDSATGVPVDEARLPGAVTAVGVSSTPPRAVAGDAEGVVLVFGLDVRPRYECSTRTRRVDPVVAVDLGAGSDGSELLAVASATAVYVYRLDEAADQCAELVGGFDLERDEGVVLDVAFAGDGGLTVIESDLFVFSFDPLADPAATTEVIDALVAERGWGFSEDDCQSLVQRPCPTS